MAEALNKYQLAIQATANEGNKYQNAIEAAKVEAEPVNKYEIAVQSAMPINNKYANAVAGTLGNQGQPTATPSFAQLLKSGFASGKGNFEYGLGTTLGMFGNEEGKKKLLDWSNQNMNDATVNRDSLMDDVIFTTGQVGLPVAAGIAAAVAAPFVGLSAAVGAGLAGFATSWGMNAGDFFSKEIAEDPNFEPGLTDLGISGLLAAPDLIPIVRGAKLLRPLGEAVADAAVDTAAKTGVKFAKELPSYVTKVPKIAAEQAVIEGVQDFTGSVAAALRTDTELDAAKIESFARASAYEALIGGIIGTPLGAASVANERSIQKQAQFDEAAITDYKADPTLNEGGELSEEFKDLGLVEGAVKQPGFFTLAVQPILGNATDTLKTRFGKYEKAGAILRNFARNRNERGLNQATVNEKSRAFEGELQTAARIFNKASKDQRKTAWKNKAAGLDPSNEVEQALYDVLNVMVPEIMTRASKGKFDLKGTLFESKDYLPIYKSLDWKTMTKPDNSTLSSAMEDMVKNGKTPEEITATMNALKNQMKSYEVHGDPLTLSREHKSGRIQDKLFKSIEKAKARGDGVISDKSRATIKSRLLKEKKSSTKEGVLTLDRSLKNLSQEWLTKNGFDEDPRSAFNQHIRMVSEQAAMIDTFGIDNRLFDEAMIELAIDTYNDGNPINAADVDKFYDVLRTQQRIHLKPISNPSIRKAQNMTRAILNINLLGLSALVSIPESLLIFMNAGGKAALTGLIQTLGRGVGGNFGLAAEQVGYTLNTALDHGINRTGEESFEVANWESAFIRWTGLPYLQHFLTVWAARSFDVHVRELVQKAKDGSLSLGELNYTNRKLMEAGFNPEKIVAAGESFFKSPEYIQQIVGLTNDTIVDPHPIDKPLWMNDERLLLITQLKGFMTVFTNRVMRSWKNKMDKSPEGNRVLATKIAPYLAMYLAGQIAMQAVREVIKNGDLDDWDEQEMQDRILSSFGYVGGMAYFVDFYNSLRFRSDPLAAIAGPAVSKGLNVAGDIVDGIERSDPEAMVNNLIKDLMPNVPFKDIMLEGMGVE